MASVIPRVIFLVATRTNLKQTELDNWNSAIDQAKAALPAAPKEGVGKSAKIAEAGKKKVEKNAFQQLSDAAKDGAKTASEPSGSEETSTPSVAETEKPDKADKADKAEDADEAEEANEVDEAEGGEEESSASSSDGEGRDND